MAAAIPITPLSRRALVAAGVALTAAPALAAPRASPAALPAALPEADLQLLQLRMAATAAHQAEGKAIDAFNDAEQAGDIAEAGLRQAEADAAWDLYVAALRRMSDTPAAGQAGLAAKASFARTFLEDRGAAEIAVMASLAADARQMLAGLPQVPPALVPPSPDAELLDLAARFADAALELETFSASESAVWASGDATARRAFYARQGEMVGAKAELLDDITALPATTREGMEAKARILAAYLDGRDDPVDLLAASLMRDLVGGVAA